MSRKSRSLLGAASLCLAFSSGPVLAEGADAAPPNPSERNHRGRLINPQTQPVQPQSRQDDQRNRDDWRNQREDRRREEERARNEQRQREERARVEQRQREEERNRSAERAREREREQREADSRRNWREREQDRDRDRNRDWRDRDRDRARWNDHGWGGPSYASPYRRQVWGNQGWYDVRPDRRRVYRNVVIVRPYGHWYYGYGRYYRDVDAYRWLGLTAITFGVLSMLNEAQQRALEDAQIAATTAPVGAPIVWDYQGARGDVVATRDGWSDSGAYCREFRQTVQIGGRVEEAYGTACQQPDGAWQVTSN